MSSCPQDTCSIAPRKTSSGWEFLLQPFGNQVPDGSNAHPRTCEWPTGIGSASVNNGLKVNADGCVWVAPAAYGIDGCDENTETVATTVTGDDAGLLGPTAGFTLTNDTPYTQTGTYTFWHGPIELQIPAGSEYQVGLFNSLAGRYCGEPYPPTGTTFPFIDPANPPTGANPLTGGELCCVYPFVVDAYKAVLGRYPDAGALAFFANQVANGGLQTADSLYDNINDVASNNNESYSGCTTTDGGQWTRCLTLAPGQDIVFDFAPVFTAQHRGGVRGRIEVKGYGVHAQMQPVDPGVC